MIPRSPTDQSRSLTLPCPCPVRQASEMENRKSYHRLSVLSSCLHRFLSSVFPHTFKSAQIRGTNPRRVSQSARPFLSLLWTLEALLRTAVGLGQPEQSVASSSSSSTVHLLTPLFFLFQQPRHSTNFLRYVGPIVDGCISEFPLPLVDKFREGTT